MRQTGGGWPVGDKDRGDSRMGNRLLLPVALSPFSGFLCCSSSPAGKGNPLLLSPGARWEPNVVFRFLYCGLTLLTLKTHPMAGRPLCSSWRVLSNFT